MHWGPLCPSVQPPEAPKCQAGPLTWAGLPSFPVYFRALVNFTHSIEYSPRLEDAGSREFREVSEAVVDKARWGVGEPPADGGRAPEGAWG